VAPVTPAIAVVVPTHQRRDRLARLVRALEQQTLPRDQWEAVIVDDCSTDGTQDALEELARTTPLDLRVARTPHQAGPALARNIGWRIARAPIVAFTDDDCTPDPEWLAAGVAAFGAPSTGIVQGKTVPAIDREHIDWTIRIVVREVLEPSPWFEGCNLFIRRDALEQCGGFDEGIAWFGEETSLAWSILDAGWGRGWAPDAQIRHDVEERSLRWHLRSHYLEGHAVRVAAAHPALRQLWWRPWALDRRGALFAAAVVGVVLAPRHKAALLLTLPYLRDVFPRTDRVTRFYVERGLTRITYDAASLAGKLVEGIRGRLFVV
jgi:GT2 family glycosyltransferase